MRLDILTAESLANHVVCSSPNISLDFVIFVSHFGY